MNSIPALVKGDTILIISPAKSIHERYITAAISLFESWGLKVEVGANALGSHHYFSGTDEQRLNDLQWAIDHPKAKAVVCARGGYGTIRIISKVNWTRFHERPKWIVGFSDITILHNVLTNMGYPSIHGVVPLQLENLSRDSETLKTLKNALFGSALEIEAEPNIYNRLGQVIAPIIGGNLAILESLIGTDVDMDYSGKVLFIEEISEHAYKVDRMMWALKKSEKLNNLKGLIIGGLTDIKGSEETFGCSIEALIKGFVEEFKYPVAFNIPSGHQIENNSIIFGDAYHLEVSVLKTQLTQRNGSS